MSTVSPSSETFAVNVSCLHDPQQREKPLLGLLFWTALLQHCSRLVLSVADRLHLHCPAFGLDSPQPLWCLELRTSTTHLPFSSPKCNNEKAVLLLASTLVLQHRMKKCAVCHGKSTCGNL